MTFIIQWMNIIKSKLTTFHWFQIIFESFFCFHNFICFIINHDFYGITFWIYYMIFITITFKRNKINLRSFMISFKYGLILLRTSQLIVFFNCLYFYIQCNCYSKNYLLFLPVITFFFMFWKTLNISNYSIFNSVHFFF